MPRWMRCSAILFLLIATKSTAALHYGIFAQPGGWYQIKARSTSAYLGNPANQIGNCQVTIKFATGSVTIAEISNDNLVWIQDKSVDFQTDDPGYTYISFSTIGGNLDIRANSEVNLFRFRNLLDCSDPIRLINHQTDKFYLNSLLPSGNSVGTNPGNNFFQLFDGEIYSGNYQNAAYCYGQQADLELSLIPSTIDIFLGLDYHYTLSVFNSGPQTATAVEVNSPIPIALEFVKAIGDGAYSSSSGIWRITEIPANTSISIQIHVKVKMSGTITMAAEVLSSELLDPDSFTGNGNISEDDYSIVSLAAALAIELASFTCQLVDRIVEITWTTISENNNLGFYLFRSESEDGPYHLISTEMIHSTISPAEERKYHYCDETVQHGQTYYYKLADIDRDGTVNLHGPIAIAVTFAEAFSLEQNYPNPFNGATFIDFFLDQTGPVELKVYNLNGELVRMLFAGVLAAGVHHFAWDGLDSKGRAVASGAYFYQLIFSSQSRTKQMLVSR